MIVKFLKFSLILVSVLILALAGIGKLVSPSCGKPFCFIDIPGFMLNIGMPIVELLICLLLAIPRARAYGINFQLCLGTAFLGYWLYSVLFMPEAECGCFGGSIKIGSALELLAILLLVCTALLFATVWSTPRIKENETRV